MSTTVEPTGDNCPGPRVVRAAPIEFPEAATALWIELQVGARSLQRPAPRQLDPEAWWPYGGQADALEAAVHGCRTCPLIALCRAYVLQAREPEGVWGGLTPVERQEIWAAEL